MNIRTLLASSVLLTLLSTNSTNPKPVHGPFKYDVGVFYFPFNTTTSVPVTPEMLRGFEDITSLVQNRVPDMVEICKKAKGSVKLHENFRLWIVLPRGEEFLVDAFDAVEHIAPGRGHAVTVGLLSPADKQALHEQILWSFREAENYYDRAPAPAKKSPDLKG